AAAGRHGGLPRRGLDHVLGGEPPRRTGNGLRRARSQSRQSLRSGEMRALMMQQRPLIERLPPVRGRLTAGASLAGVTWFRVGGAAEVLFKPADLMDLQGFLERKPEDVPVTVLGVGSNLWVRDGGIPGVVLRLGRAFAEVRVTGTQVIAGAAAL